MTSKKTGELGYVGAVLVLALGACGPANELAIDADQVGTTTQALNVGVGEFYGLSRFGADLSYLHHATNWRDSWTMIVPGDYGDLHGTVETSLLFYDAVAGQAEIHQVNDGRLTLQRQFRGWRSTWTSIVPALFDVYDAAKDQILFYEASTGHAELYTANGRDYGDGLRFVRNIEFEPGFTTILAGHFDDSGAKGLLMYSPSAAEVRLYSNDGRGNFTLNRTYPTLGTFTKIVAGRFDESDTTTDVLLWAGGAQVGYFYAIDGLGRATYMSTLRRDNPWTQRWDDFIVGDFESGDHVDDLLIYDAGNGHGSFRTSNGDGTLTELRTYTNWRRTWQKIIPGHFGGFVWRDDLLFYTPTP